MRILFAAVLSVALVGCMTTETPPATQATTVEPPKLLNQVQLTKEDVASIQAGVRSSLKDPDSARFGRMIAGKEDDGSFTVCLMVNAKNSYGGYSGEKPFMGMLFKDKKPAVFAVVPGGQRFPQYRDQAVYRVCSDKGLSLAERNAGWSRLG